MRAARKRTPRSLSADFHPSTEISAYIRSDFVSALKVMYRAIPPAISLLYLIRKRAMAV
jgi:hypothetical protein